MLTVNTMGPASSRALASAMESTGGSSLSATLWVAESPGLAATVKPCPSIAAARVTSTVPSMSPALSVVSSRVATSMTRLVLLPSPVKVAVRLSAVPLSAVPATL